MALRRGPEQGPPTLPLSEALSVAMGSGNAGGGSAGGGSAGSGNGGGGRGGERARGPVTVEQPGSMIGALPSTQSAASGSAAAATLSGRPGASARRRERVALLPSRYEDLGALASGGFGEVWRVRDRVLQRVLAMKVLRAEFAGSPHLRARFLTEARITAQLQHPGIVAVHDQGELAGGRCWFTMKEVRGRTLGAVIEEIHGAARADGFFEAPSGWTFRRLLDAFARLSQAVAFAHSRGVMHRDLKPENLMVGEFGEVQVMDWGLARRVEPDLDDSLSGLVSVDLSPDEPDEDEAAILAARAASPDAVTQDLTRLGDVLGTPAYMPPEQALGQRERHGRHSDVYALGAILYHLLSGRPPYTGSSQAVLLQVRAGPPTPLAEVLVGRPPVPEELCALCERAMHRDIEGRWPDAERFAHELVAFLEGARRREQALAVLDQARALEPEIAALRALSASRREEAQALLGQVQPFDPVEKKRAGWQLEDEAAALGRKAALCETAWLQTVHGALILHPELPEAHAVLADHYREHLSAAELAHEDEDAARFEAQLRAHDRGQHIAFLRGEGRLTLVTDPPGAVVRLEHFELQDRRLLAVDRGVIGTTPLREVPLQHGSYRLRLQAPGCAEVLYPVIMERDAHWDGRPPGDFGPHPIVLPRAGELGPDDCYVPAGFCWTGGDEEAGDSLPLRRLWIDAFVLRRFPVTNREFIAFLDDLVAQGREDEALSACPKAQLGMSADTGEHLVFGRDEARRFVLMPDEQGRPSLPDRPVVAVDWFGACAYAAWLGERTGLPWRLPDELEREKAARGVDGRLCPWGDHLDATFACTVDSRVAQPIRESVESYPVDESPYGVRGLAGNSRDWCENLWLRQGPLIARGRLVRDPAPAGSGFRAARGGAWCSPLHASRSACRFGGQPAVRRMTTGFRLARSLPLRASG